MRHIISQLALVALLAIVVLVVMNRSVQALVVVCPGCEHVGKTYQTHCRCRFENEVRCSWTQWNYDYIRDVDIYDCDGQLTFYCHSWKRTDAAGGARTLNLIVHRRHAYCL